MSVSNDEPPAGILLSIHMINFMKHDNLLIDLKPHANFITGRNGSGKSSILVALAVGLGSNTRLSGRGNNMGDLIKDGRNEATIIITIKNSPSGYRMDMYGDTIVVTRKITRSSSRFDIANLPKSSATQVREELNRILQFYNIQIDNPCSIMHQDTAREFIGTSTPQRKYDLFMRGTLLTRLTEDIHKIKSNIENVKRQKDDRLTEKVDLDRQFEDIKRKNDIVEEADDLLNRIHDLENELMWSYYHVAAIAEKKANDELDASILKHQEANKKVEEKQKIADEAKNQSDEYRLKVADAMKKLAEVRKEKDKLANKLDKIKLNLTTQKNQLKHRENSIERTKSDLESKKNEKIKLVKIRDQSAQDVLEKKRKYIADLEEKQDKINKDLEDADTNFQEVNNEYQKLLPNLDNLRSAVRDSNNTLSEITQKLRSLKSVFYGNDAGGSSSLINQIKRERSRFTFLPIGPVSKYITLVEESWGIAVQHIIGKLLDYFLVNSFEDEQLLRKIGGDSLKIIIIDFTRKRYHIQSQRPSNSAKLIIELINIKQEVIRGSSTRSSQNAMNVQAADIITNALIDVNNVDHIWCVEDEELARELSFGPEHHLTIVKSGVQFKFQNGYELRIGAQRTNCTIGVDESRRIAKLEEDEKEAIRAKNELHEKYKSLEQEAKNLKSKRNSYENVRSRCTSELNKIKVKLQNPPDETDNYDAQISAIDTRIEKLERNLEEDQKNIPNIKETIENLQKEKKSVREKIAELSTELNQSEDFKSESDKYFNKERHAQMDLNKEKNIANSFYQKVEKLKEAAKEASADARKNLEKARQHSPDCEEKYKDVARAPATLAQLLMDERKKYEVAQSISGLDFAEIRKQFASIKSQVEKAVRFLNELQEFLEQAETGLDAREEKLKSIIQSVTRRAKVSFLNYQRQRRYIGKLHFKHDQKTIEIAVKSKADSEYTDVSSLSGGEKSYCLVSLLLSLWEVMECPFYCVDEFDVFMDDVNRQAATSLLVKGASVMENRQFIFITPLSLNSLKNDDRVTIFEVAKDDS